MASIILGLSIIGASLLIGFIAITFILIWLKSHRLILRQVLNDKTYIRVVWVWDKKDKDTEEIYWKNVPFAKRIKCERPPAEVINIGTRGRMYAEGYILSDDAEGFIEIKWIKDNGKKIQHKLLDKENNLIEDSFKPFGTTAKSFVMNQFKKSVERKSHRWDLNKITQIATLGIMGFAVILTIIFLPDILDSMSAKQSAENGVLDRYDALISNMEKISNNQALITAATGKLLGQDLNGLQVNSQIVQNIKPVENQNSVIMTTNETQPYK